MDVEALRKLNTLAGELQKHRISLSSEDALKQAEHILQPIQTMQEQSSIERSETSKIIQNTETLAERQYKLLLEMNNKKFEDAINTLQNTINNLSQEITRLKIDINLLSTRTASQTTQTTTQQEAKTEEKPKEEQKKEPHPRQGGFVPGDVSIEKMFYFGHK